MSYCDYHASLRLSGEHYPFYALIMAAMKQADSENIEKLKSAFPEVWEELRQRYKARAGILPDDFSCLNSKLP